MGFWSTINKVRDKVSDFGEWVGNGISTGLDHVNDFVDFWTDQGEKIIGSDATEILDNLTGKTANKQFEEQMDYQKHYYENMIDSMTRAGLNPGLLSSSGGSMPSGASATGNSMSLGVLSGLIDAVSEVGVKTARIDNIQADTEKKTAETEGAKIDNMIKDKVGLDQAYATLNVTSMTAEKASQETKNLVQKYALDKASELKTLSETQKLDYEKESIKIANELSQAKFDELKDIGDLNGRMVTLTESQANAFAGNLKLLGSGVGGNVSVNQLTSTQIPLAWYVKAINPNLSDSTRKDYLQRIVWLLTEDTGTKIKEVKKASK